MYYPYSTKWAQYAFIRKQAAHSIYKNRFVPHDMQAGPSNQLLQRYGITIVNEIPQLQ